MNKNAKFLTGFTLIDTLMAATIGLLVIGSILSTFILVERNFNIGMVRTTTYAITRFNLERVVKDIVAASQAVIIDGAGTATQGNRIDLTLYSSSDPGITTTYTKSYYLQNGDEIWCDNAGNISRIVTGIILNSDGITGNNDDNLFRTTDSSIDVNIVEINLERQTGYREGGAFNVKLHTEVRLKNKL